MATYLNADDLTTLVPESVLMELSDDNTTCETDFEMIEEILQSACEEADGYLRGRYSLPFAKTPTLIKQCVKQIARYMLYERRPEGFELPPAVIDGRKNAIKTLEKIRSGLISLGVVETGGIVDDDGEFHVRVRSTSRRSKRPQSAFSKAVESW